jgi:hypothetical protein
MRARGKGRADGAGEAAAEWPSRGNPLRITKDDIARAARELVAAYGPEAIALMQKRTRAVRRRGDAESATLWFALAKAVEEQLASGDGAGAEAAAAD